MHLWHGDLSARKRFERHRRVSDLDFDPNTDIVISDNGCWGWNSEKPELHEFLKTYFDSRADDGLEGHAEI